MLQAIDIHKSYGSLHVLKGVSLQLNKGEVVALVGSSGAGKSTLLQIIGALDDADSGKVLFEGKDISSFNAKQRSRFRNQSVGFIFQFHHLLPEFTALENVCMPAYIAGTHRDRANTAAHKLMSLLGVEDRASQKPNTMSGGEQQRVAVARAMINEPSLILADEPTGNLDTANSEALYDLIFGLAHSTEVSFLIATHDMTLASKADRVLRIQDGKIMDSD